MAYKIKGLHHITAVSGPPKQNYEFYTRVLGLRFTKKTINFDDPGTYHLYYGNYEATPGSSITFFPWEAVPQGIPKTGEATVVSYAVPNDSIDFWADRFKKHGVEILDEVNRFGGQGIRVKDIEGMMIEVVESEGVDSIKQKKRKIFPVNLPFVDFTEPHFPWLISDEPLNCCKNSGGKNQEKNLILHDFYLNLKTILGLSSISKKKI